MEYTAETVSQQQPVEVWAAVPGFPLYEASSFGRIRSFRVPDRKTGKAYKIISLCPSTRGYLTLGAFDENGVRKTRYAHRMVCAAFHGPIPEDMLVLHNDDVRTNNLPSNLRIGTASDNSADSVKNGGRVVGLTDVKSWGRNSELNERLVRTIRRQFAAGLTRKQIAASHGLPYPAVSHCVAGRTWAWVADTAAETAQVRAQAVAALTIARAQVALKRSAPHSAPQAAPTSKGMN